MVETYSEEIEVIEGLGIRVGATQAHDDDAY